MADLHHGQRRRGPARLANFSGASAGKIPRLLEPRFAQKKNAEQQNHEHEPEVGRCIAAEVKRKKVTSDK